MEKNRFKMRISNMFRSSYASCNSKNINNDVLEKPQNLQHFQLIELFSPRPRRHPFHSLCIPKISPEISQNQENFKPNKKFPPRSKISERQHLLHPSENDIDFLKCPPVSPLNFETKKGRKFKNKTRKSRSRGKTFDILDFQGFNYNGLFSSDEESEEDEEKTTPFFSSRSLSSVSSESTKRHNPRKTKKAGRSCRKNGEKRGTLNLGGSFAMVKNSCDPYNDFRTSMVEMIVEKNILSAEDLEKMLQCFLSLNSNHHHRIIVEVFTEIWEALFSRSS